MVGLVRLTLCRGHGQVVPDVFLETLVHELTSATCARITMFTVWTVESKQGQQATDPTSQARHQSQFQSLTNVSVGKRSIRRD